MGCHNSKDATSPRVSSSDRLSAVFGSEHLSPSEEMAAFFAACELSQSAENNLVSIEQVKTCFCAKFGDKRGMTLFQVFAEYGTRSEDGSKIAIKELVESYGPKAGGSEAKCALLVVDMQYDFMPARKGERGEDGELVEGDKDSPDGSLAVGEGADLIHPINSLIDEIKWDLVVFSKDWHPPSHCSFIDNNTHRPGAKVFKLSKLDSGRMQMMWPRHCVVDSEGAKIHHMMNYDQEKHVTVKKGTKEDVDSYSVFFDNDHKSQTELDSVLKKNGITHVYCVGLAYDYCVGFTALDAKKLKYNTYFVKDLTKAVAPESQKIMDGRLLKQRIPSILASEVSKYLRVANP